MTSVRPTLTALGLAALVLVGACAAPATPVRAAPEPPPGLSGFYDQQIVFEPCAPYAASAVDELLYASDRFDCARVQVPLDYADPDGPRGEVALLRAKARGEKIGSLLVNLGGPGGSVDERFDVFGFDPRGVDALISVGSGRW